MPYTIYDYATGANAEVDTPPDAWILRGQASNLPYIASYDNWLERGVLDVLEAHARHYNAAVSNDWLADTIHPLTGYTPGDITGVYLSRSQAPGTVGILHWARGNDIQIFVEDSGGTDKHNWLYADDGTLQITNTLAVYGFLAGLDTTSKLRYGYASTYPTFRFDFDPIQGGWTVWDPQFFMLDGPASTSSYVVMRALTTYAGTGDMEITHPLRFPFDTGRTTETVFELMQLRAGIGVFGGSGRTITVNVVRRLKSDLTAQTTIMSVSHNSTTATQTSTTGAPIVLDYSTYKYEISIVATDIGNSNTQTAEVGLVELEIRKRAVE